MQTNRRESVLQAARSNDRRRLLVALKHRLADAAGTCSPRDLAAITRRISDVTAEIAGIDERRELDALSADADAWDQWTDRR